MGAPAVELAAGNPPEVEAAFQAAREELVAEIVDGELHLSPRPRPRHARTATKLGARLEGPFDSGEGGPGGWILLFEPELHLGPRPDKLVPNLAGWRRERFPLEAFAEHAPVGLSVAPDWVCEVLSGSTEALDRGKKLGLYGREGVRHLWLVNPTLYTVEVYRLERGAWVVAGVHQGPVPARIEPFDAVALDLGAIWV